MTKAEKAGALADEVMKIARECAGDYNYPAAETLGKVAAFLRSPHMGGPTREAELRGALKPFAEAARLAAVAGAPVGNFVSATDCENAANLLALPPQPERTGEVAALRDALAEIDGCFEAAYVEGLSERLNEVNEWESGSLCDLITRRLLPAREAAIRALSAAPPPPACQDHERD